jgi:hypothetical protein
MPSLSTLTGALPPWLSSPPPLLGAAFVAMLLVLAMAGWHVWCAFSVIRC